MYSLGGTCITFELKWRREIRKVDLDVFEDLQKYLNLETFVLLQEI